MSWVPIPKLLVYGSISLTLTTSFSCTLHDITYTYSIILFSFLTAGKIINNSCFETSTLLVMMTTVQCLMTVFVRCWAASALNTASALQVWTVKLAENNGVWSIPVKLVHI